MSTTFLTISIPAYNDEIALKALLASVVETCVRLGIDFKILIINDGSKDETLLTAKAYAAQFSNVQVLSHSENLGFGPTLYEVFTLPRSEWILFLPGDNQFPASNIETMLKYTKQFDFILGYRKERNDNLMRKLYSVIYNQIISWVANYRVRDVNSIVLFRSKILDEIQLKSKSAFIHAELFIKTKQSGFKVAEVDIVHQKRAFGFGSGAKFNVAFHTMSEVFRFLAGKL